MEELIAALEKEFGGLPIYTLGKYIQKIALITKVRSAVHKDDYTDYGEATLNNVDQYGVIDSYTDGKKLGPANKTTLNSQQLMSGNILISYRGQRGFGVVRFEKQLDKVIVGNNSAIRIQLNVVYKDLAPLIQAYLKKSYVQEYLKYKSGKKALLSADILKELPIPKLRQLEKISFEKYHNKKLEQKALILRTKNILDTLLEQTQKSIENNLAFYLKNDKNILSTSKEDTQLIKELQEICHKALKLRDERSNFGIYQ